MLAYAKLSRRGQNNCEFMNLMAFHPDNPVEIVLDIQLNLEEWQEEELAELKTHNRRYQHSLLVTDGQNVGKYDRFVQRFKNTFFQQVLSIPHMFYDFDQQALPTMTGCCIEAKLNPSSYCDPQPAPFMKNAVHCKDLNAREYLFLMRDLTTWAHENCVEPEQSHAQSYKLLKQTALAS